jgi:hypothetical protein
MSNDRWRAIRGPSDLGFDSLAGTGVTPVEVVHAARNGVG